MNEDRMRELFEKTDAYAYGAMAEELIKDLGKPKQHMHPPELAPCDCTNIARVRIDIPAAPKS
jgi:hypothetical protein